VINTDSSGSGADQPDQDDDIHGLRQIEEIVEPVEKREPCRNRPELNRRDKLERSRKENSRLKNYEPGYYNILKPVVIFLTVLILRAIPFPIDILQAV
jgi:hypothetical protein